MCEGCSPYARAGGRQIWYKKACRMEFNSLEFIVFLYVVVAVYFIIPTLPGGSLLDKERLPSSCQLVFLYVL